MGPLLSHLLTGERVFGRLVHLDQCPATYGLFLLGCVIPDVSGVLRSIRRPVTHFWGPPDAQGQRSDRDYCDNLLRQLDNVLVQPWRTLERTGQAFVAGYLCHLAADEEWKEFRRRLQDAWVNSCSDSPWREGVVYSVVSIQSREMFAGIAEVTAAVDGVTVPDLFTHVPYLSFQQMWQVAREYLLDGKTLESYFQMLARAGRPEAEIEENRQRHLLHWDRSVALVAATGGVADYVDGAVKRAIQEVPRLWGQVT